MNNLQIFNNAELGSIRTVVIDDEPWFVGKDIAEYFGDSNYRRSLSRLDEDEKGVSQIATPGGTQQMTIINESGLYSLMFYMQPQKAKGVVKHDTLINERIIKLKKFKRWVTSEVLPSIRKTGHYGNTPLKDVVNLIRITRDNMEKQGATPTQIAETINGICEQYGINLPNFVIHPEQVTMKNVFDMVDYVFSQPRGRGHKAPTYDDYIAHKANVKMIGGD